MDDVRRLLELEEIKQLRARYCLLLDAQAWDALRALFTDDCRFEVGSGSYSNPDDFVANLREHLTGESHVHVVSMPVIEHTGPDTARGFWAFSNRGALGHYQDEYRREGGVWKISSLTMTWIHPPSEELLETRKGQFEPERWKPLAERWGRPAGS